MGSGICVVCVWVVGHVRQLPSMSSPETVLYLRTELIVSDRCASADGFFHAGGYVRACDIGTATIVAGGWRCGIVRVTSCDASLLNHLSPVSSGLLSVFSECSQRTNETDLNWTDLQQVDAFIVQSRQRHDLIGCSETRTVGAQSVMNTFISTRLELENWSLVHLSSSAVNKPSDIIRGICVAANRPCRRSWTLQLFCWCRYTWTYAAPCWVTLSIRLFRVVCFWSLFANMTSSTEPEVHNVSQHRQKKTEPHKDLVTIGRVVIEICSRTNRQTHRHTERQSRHADRNTPLIINIR